jgi:predicted regulator of Ras-like GTPase activity (Roadblock/LC7/MglB family)
MFLETLKEITNRIGNARCVFLMGMDGMPVEKVIRDTSFNVDELTAEFTTVIKVTNASTAEVDAGTVDEILILSDKMILLTKSITSEYFLLLVLPSDGNLGRARFELKKAKYMLEKEFV